MLKRYLCLTLLLTLSACSWARDTMRVETEEEKLMKASVGKSAEILYNEARDKMDAKEYKESITAFEEVERNFPYSELAVRGQVMAGYAAYKAADYTQALSILERYTKMHPGDDSLGYAYYMIALCYYEQIVDIGRDQKMTENAMQALTDVVRRFPDSDYARDAKLKLDLAYDHLAGKEMEIGRYYLKRDENLSAINRFRFVVENYQTTSQVPEALHRLVEAYLRLGVTPEARRYAAVLGHNFPASEWYKMSYGLLNEGYAKKQEEESGFLGVF